MQRLCPRCRYAVSLPDDGSLCFCGHCGAPQVRLSEELLDRISSDRVELETREAAAGAAGPAAIAPGEVDWRGALHCAALAGAVAFALSLLSVPLPAFVLLGLLWAVGAPVVSLGIYVARFRDTRPHPGFAARLGLLTGLAVLLGSSVVNVSAMLIQRFVLHRAAEFDTLFAQRIQAMQAALVQQSGASAAAPVIAVLNVPEFRAGMLLSGFGLFAAGYLLFSTAGGAFAGLLRARAPESTPRP